MANFQTLKKEILNYIRARIPLIIVQTSERERVERLLTEIAMESNIDMEFYSDSKQLYKPAGLSSSLDINNDPIVYATEMFKKKRYVTFTIYDINHISNDNIFSRDVLSTIYLARENVNTLILVTCDPVWSRLISVGLVTTLDYPDNLEIEHQVIDFITKYKNRYPVDWNKSDILYVSSILKGFSEMQIDNILSAEIAVNAGLFKKNIHKLTEQKNRLFGTIPNVEYIEVDNAIEVSGLDNLKEWLKEKKNIFFSPYDVLAKYDLTFPKGILLAGVPGCGKSLSAKMISSQWQLPLFKFNLDTIYDKWLGESERKMQDALKFIDNIAPCILWIDEIEKALSSQEGSNDTGKRIISQFLFWLQESKSRVFLVATANDISLLPPELFRKGRFSEIFFVDLPNRKERASTILYYLDKSLHYKVTTEELQQLIEISNDYSYADIETAIKEVTQKIIISNDTNVNIDMIKEKFNKIMPISKSNPEIIEKCRKWGYERAVPASTESEK